MGWWRGLGVRLGSAGKSTFFIQVDVPSQTQTLLPRASCASVSKMSATLSTGVESEERRAARVRRREKRGEGGKADRERRRGRGRGRSGERERQGKRGGDRKHLFVHLTIRTTSVADRTHACATHMGVDDASC